MKKLANLKGVKTLNRTQQKSINGGIGCPGSCSSNDDCESCNQTVFEQVDWVCINNQCTVS